MPMNTICMKVAVSLLSFMLMACGNGDRTSARKDADSEATSNAVDMQALSLTLGLSPDQKMFEVEIRNPLPVDLIVPADIVNGPRNVNRSVFLMVKDTQGNKVDRCAIVELNENALTAHPLRPGEQVTIVFPRFLVEATYCVKNYYLWAFIGSESDAHSAYESNILEVEAK